MVQLGHKKLGFESKFTKRVMEIEFRELYTLQK